MTSMAQNHEPTPGSWGASEGGIEEASTLAQLNKDIKEHLLMQRPVYESLAKASDFSIQFGEVTCFNHRTDTIIIGVAQLAKMGITDLNLIDFVVFHEIGHFCEFKEDPEGYLKPIEETKKRPDQEGKLYFDLYNCLQDIYVNQRTANRAPVYRKGYGFSDEILDLYRTAAFAKRDFSDRPFCIQYMQYLLNLGMGVAEDINLSPEVKAKIDEGVGVLGEDLSYDRSY